MVVHHLGEKQSHLRMESETTARVQTPEEKLLQYASAGSMDGLKSILREDRNILDRFAISSYCDNPLHLAAKANRIPFALEVMRVKPALGYKENNDGHIPVHVALLNDRLYLVKVLVRADPRLIRYPGGGGFTLLFHAVSRRKLELVRWILKKDPEAVKDISIYGDSILQFAATKYISLPQQDVENPAIPHVLFSDLVNSLKDVLDNSDLGMECKTSLLNHQNHKGWTILHSLIELQMNRMLVCIRDWGVPVLDDSLASEDGMTAVDKSQAISSEEIRLTMSKLRLLKDQSSNTKELSWKHRNFDSLSDDSKKVYMDIISSVAKLAFAVVGVISVLSRERDWVFALLWFFCSIMFFIWFVVTFLLLPPWKTHMTKIAFGSITLLGLYYLVVISAASTGENMTFYAVVTCVAFGVSAWLSYLFSRQN